MAPTVKLDERNAFGPSPPSREVGPVTPEVLASRRSDSRRARGLILEESLPGISSRIPSGAFAPVIGRACDHPVRFLSFAAVAVTDNSRAAGALDIR